MKSLILAAVITVILAAAAYAHDPKHPEWSEWLMSQENQRGSPCCDGEDTFVLGDDEWKMAGDHYEVLHYGSWMKVPSWALTKTTGNITGHALLWIWGGHVQCFKPGTFY